MEENNKNIEIFTELKSPFNRSEEDLWLSIDSKISEQKSSKVFSLSFSQYAIAASISLLIAIAAVMNLYTEGYSSKRGEQIAYILPDGSKVELNSESSISYKPLMWWMSRELKFEGEGFFEVEKGSNFKVESNNGTTEVLGTSFNINSRNQKYEVYCESGRVRVSSVVSNSKIEINPGEIAKLSNDKLEIDDAISKSVLAWKEGKFNFTSTTILNVISELEISYDIKINLEIENQSKYQYTAYFEKYETADESLELICKSLNLRYEKTSDRVYSIYEPK